MEIHKVICDKCGVEAKMINGRSGEYTNYKLWHIPDLWKCIKNKHLCQKCADKLSKLENSFLQ